MVMSKAKMKMWSSIIIRNKLKETDYGSLDHLRDADVIKLLAEKFNVPLPISKMGSIKKLFPELNEQLHQNKMIKKTINAKQKAGILPKKGGKFENKTQEIVTQQQINEFYESWDWKRVRYDFIKNKKRRCECCGATPDNGERIVVDHILPIRHHWSSRFNISNLQLLCDSCNMGKGSRDTTDWRIVKLLTEET